MYRQSETRKLVQCTDKPEPRLRFSFCESASQSQERLYPVLPVHKIEYVVAHPQLSFSSHDTSFRHNIPCSEMTYIPCKFCRISERVTLYTMACVYQCICWLLPIKEGHDETDRCLSQASEVHVCSCSLYPSQDGESGVCIFTQTSHSPSSTPPFSEARLHTARASSGCDRKIEPPATGKCESACCFPSPYPSCSSAPAPGPSRFH